MGTVPEMNPAQAMGRRPARRRLLDPAPDPVTAAFSLGGVHAQVASGVGLIAGVGASGIVRPTSTTPVEVPRPGEDLGHAGDRSSVPRRPAADLGGLPWPEVVDAIQRTVRSDPHIRQRYRQAALDACKLSEALQNRLTPAVDAAVSP